MILLLILYRYNFIAMPWVFCSHTLASVSLGVELI